MARVVVVDPDPRIRGALVRLLGAAGHLTSEFSDAASVDQQAADAALVFAAAGPGGCLIDPTAAQLSVLNPNARIVWTGPLAGAIRPAVVAGVGIDVLELPTRLPALKGLLARHLKKRVGDRWSGEAFLRQVDGHEQRFPPIRVLFLAHRLGASGTLRVGEAEIDVQQGKIADARGLPGVGMGGGLMHAIGAAIGQGQTPDVAMQSAGVAVLVDLLKLAATGNGDRPVRFVSKDIRPPVVLPTRLPRLLGLALEQVRPPDTVRHELGARPSRLVSLHPPDDSPERMWGLSPVALRVVRAGRSARNLGALLSAAGGAGKDSVWTAVAFLRQLGILRFDDELPAESAASLSAATMVDDIVIEAVAPATPEPVPEPVDPRAEALLEELARLQALSPWVLFSLEDPTDVTLDEVTQRFRDCSAEHHPDRFATEPEQVREAAAECFAVWVDARDRFDDEAFRAEVRERLIAARDGRVYVSEGEKKKAKLALSQGLYHARRKTWPDAIAAFEESVALDPTEWEAGFQLLLARWRSGDLPAAQAAEALAEVSPTTLKGRAEVRFQVGEARLAAGDEAGAYKSFEEAVSAVPDHTGAARRLRLRALRQEKAAESGQKAGIRGLFKWGRKGDG